ncbi:hypothetical protein N7461_001563 [Penicillium sp. DV-2018c]|nr:hypothetical protein N7461_001563 [Penicillium sp. DV-2018c]
MRHRLTFSRSNSNNPRDRSMTVNLSTETTRPDCRRLRSASSPQSPTHEEPTWDISDPNSSRGYSYTDEPGYFRHDSPLIDRQEVDEDLEADIKHACALLSHSIDRGIPAGLSYQSAVPDWTKGSRVAGQSSANAVPSSLDQHSHLLPAPKPTDSETDSSKKHDSGVDMSLSPSGQQRGPCRNSVSGTDTSRFYNKRSQSSDSPPPISSAHRSRGQSLTETIEKDQPWDRSYSSSLVPFPYSSPIQQSKWNTDPLLDSPVSPVSPPNEPDKILESVRLHTRTSSQKHEESNKPDPSPITPSTHSLGSAGMTWLRASRDMQRLADEERARRPKPPNRFYSSNSRTITESNCEWLTKEFWEDREPSLYGDASSLSLSAAMSAAMGNGSRAGSETPGRLGSLSMNGDSPGYPYRMWAGQGHSGGMSSSDEFKHQETVYVVPGEAVTSRRWKRASVMLRRLAGIGRRKGLKTGNGDVVC